MELIDLNTIRPLIYMETTNCARPILERANSALHTKSTMQASGCAALVPPSAKYCDEHRVLHPEEVRSAAERGYGYRW